jgi:hypothetical protein
MHSKPKPHPNDRDVCLYKSFRQWIDNFDPKHRKQWETRLKYDRETATCEAQVWELIQRHGVVVEPNSANGENSKSPDYVCFSNGEKFYVEASFLRQKTITARTGLPDPPTRGRSGFNPFGINGAIFQKCTDKSPQCGSVNDSPCVLAVGLNHSMACWLCLKKEFIQHVLIGEPRITWQVDPSQEPITDTQLVTFLDFAAFLRPSEATISEARTSISAVLVCPFDRNDRPALGIIHPRAARPFNTRLLPQIEFCSVEINTTDGTLTPTWTRHARNGFSELPSGSE